MSVTVREKKLKDNRTSLYLDIYVNRKRSYQILELYTFTNPKGQSDRDHNKAIKNKAELIRIRMLNQMIDTKYQIHSASSSTYTVLDYFNYLAQKHRKSKTYRIWHSVVLILEKFMDGEVRFIKDLTPSDVENIRNYILNYVKKNQQGLSSNSASTYFSKIKRGLNQAYNDKLINIKLTDNVKSIPRENVPRQYLTVDELVKLKDAKCYNELLKKAFLFSAVTGLRWSDISNLKWENINHSSDRGYYIQFKQQKTGSDQWISINENAVILLGEKQNPDHKIFKGLSYSPHFKSILAKWMQKAKINKKITFHCARHSFATMLVTKDVNISTISNMLGHKDIRTTQIYAQVVDKAKVEAAKLLDIF